VRLAVGIHDRSMEDETNSFEPGLGEFFKRFKVTDRSSLLLDRHEIFPESIFFLHLKHKG
jgi:hypothetical protein